MNPKAALLKWLGDKIGWKLLNLIVWSVVAVIVYGKFKKSTETGFIYLGFCVTIMCFLRWVEYDAKKTLEEMEIYIDGED